MLDLWISKAQICDCWLKTSMRLRSGAAIADMCRRKPSQVSVITPKENS